MPEQAPNFVVKLADCEADLKAAQELRYDVFSRELGANGATVCHQRHCEQDRYDPYCDHLLLLDQTKLTKKVVGVYRLLRESAAKRAGGFYSENEFDLSQLRKSGRNLLELGRTCLHPDYRGGAGMFHLWSALADYSEAHGSDLLFGTASFQGTNTELLAQPMSLLHHEFSAPQELSAHAHGSSAISMDILSPDKISRRSAMLAMPALIKGYLRLGGRVGQGAWIDHDFNTTDICLIMDARNMTARQSLYRKRPAV